MDVGNTTIVVQKMTLRDFFTGQAMATLISNETLRHEDVADWAYDQADAMLKKREK